jgi:heme O synthase-like polyprenyltransferase
MQKKEHKQKQSNVSQCYVVVDVFVVVSLLPCFSLFIYIYIYIYSFFDGFSFLCVCLFVRETTVSDFFVLKATTKLNATNKNKKASFYYSFFFLLLLSLLLFVFFI